MATPIQNKMKPFTDPLEEKHTWENLSVLFGRCDHILVLLRRIGRNCRHETNPRWINRWMREISKVEGHKIAEMAKKWKGKRVGG